MIVRHPVMAVLVFLLFSQLLIGKEQLEFVRIHILDDNTGAVIARLQTLALDITHVEREGKFIEAFINPAQVQQVQKENVTISTIIPDMDTFARQLRQNGYFEPFHTYDEMVMALQAIEAAYPEIAALHDIGDSYLKTVNPDSGYDIWALKISDNVATDENDEPEVLFMANLHAREIITPEIIMYFSHYLVDNYGTNGYVTHLVNNREIWLLPTVNPDGHEFVFKGDYLNRGNRNDPITWRKNMQDNNNNGQFDIRADGVDLNRNFGYEWGYDNAGSSPDSSSLTYRGTGPFSEPETQAIRDFVNAHHFIICLSYHSYSQLWLYPWGYAPINTPDDDIFVALADSCVAYNGYAPGNFAKGTIYRTNGNSDDWFYGEQVTKNKIYAFTPEVGSSDEGAFWPEHIYLDKLILENLGPNLYMTYAAGEEPIVSHSIFKGTNGGNIYSIYATITPAIPLTGPVSLDTTTFKIYYNHTGIAPFDSMKMTLVSEPDYYVAHLHDLGTNVTVFFYIAARDKKGRQGTSPRGVPITLDSFFIGPDGLPPEIIQNSIPDYTDDITGPYLIEAQIIDDRPLTTAYIYFRKSTTVDFFRVPMQPKSDNLYYGEIPGQFYNTYIQYYLEATSRDGVSRDPDNAPNSFYEFMVTNRSARISLSTDSLVMNARAGATAIDSFAISNSGLVPLRFAISDSIPFTSVNRTVLGLVPWLKITPGEGVVRGETQVTIGITADAATLNAGIYQAELFIVSNDSVDPVINLPILFKVDDPAGDISQVGVQPEQFVLYPNFPNPFNRNTEIIFEIPVPAYVNIVIYNTVGQKIRKLVGQHYFPGIHHIKWDATGSGGLPVTGGVYLIRVEATTTKNLGCDHFIAARKIIYLP